MNSTAIDPRIVEQAAVWMARLWSCDASEEERQACARWRAEHADHELAWRRLQAFEEQLDAVPRDAARHALRQPAVAAYRLRRRALKLLGMAIAVGGAARLVYRSEPYQQMASDHSTAVAEVRTVTLADGSRVVLASATAIDVRFDAAERRIILRAGEIMVTTGHQGEAARPPLIVQSAQGGVRALGTRFTVRQDDGLTQVAVYEGAVDITPRHAAQAVLRLAAGRRSVFSAQHVRPPAVAQDSATAWTRGLLVAEQMRVADLVAALGRYRSGLLRCDPAVAELRVSGVFPLHDTDRALHNLTLGLPVALDYRTRYWVTVREN